MGALKGQDALIIALSGLAPHGIDTTLIQAAGDAGVPRISPNEWAPDTANEELVKDVVVFQSKGKQQHSSVSAFCVECLLIDRCLQDRSKAIADLGKRSYIAVSTGFWYEWSLAIPSAFGIDSAKRTVTLFDEGETRGSDFDLASS